MVHIFYLFPCNLSHSSPGCILPSDSRHHGTSILSQGGVHCRSLFLWFWFWCFSVADEASERCVIPYAQRFHRTSLYTIQTP